MEDHLKDLEQGVSRLEAAFGTATAGTQVTAPLRVVDAHGRPVAVIDVYAYDNTPYLTLLSPEGREAVRLIVAPEGGGVAITNATGATVAVLSAGSDGGDLWLHDKDGELVAALCTDRSGTHLRIYDRDGGLVVSQPE